MLTKSVENGRGTGGTAQVLFPAEIIQKYACSPLFSSFPLFCFSGKVFLKRFDIC